MNEGVNEAALTENIGGKLVMNGFFNSDMITRSNAISQLDGCILELILTHY